MNFQNKCSIFIICFVIFTRNANVARALVIKSNTTSTIKKDTQKEQNTPSAVPSQTLSPLASKLIFESPSIDNIYKEFVVTSKPLNLRKYSNRLKVKKTKKDSKIFFIPIPPLPYRYIPGVGYEYQPMKINPIMQDGPVPVPTKLPSKHSSKQNTTMKGDQSKSSKIIRMKHNNYYFNGRPFRLQVAHAQTKQHITPSNLKSKLYFNKNIIY